MDKNTSRILTTNLQLFELHAWMRWLGKCVEAKDMHLKCKCVA